MTALDVDRLRKLAEQATQGPYYAAIDDAEECGPHANSGLSLVETGRHGDWPIARLCEGPAAAWIAATDPQTILALIAAYEQARDDAERLHGLREFLPEQMAKIESAYDCNYV